MKSKLESYFLWLLAILFALLSGCEKEKENNITVIDIDGNVYTTVAIGSQIWMVENLKVMHYRNGDPILNLADNVAWSGSDQGAFCWYDNNEAGYKDIYGALYNWYAVDDIRNIAPDGWHVATDEDWTALANFLGGDAVAGSKLREAGTIHWDDPNNDATNETGFTALPGGNRGANGLYVAKGEYGQWWTTMESSATNAFNRSMYYNYPVLERNSNNKNYGFSVRCIKD